MAKKNERKRPDAEMAAILNNNSRAEAARILGVKLRTLYRYVKRMEDRGQSIVKRDQYGNALDVCGKQ